MKKIAKQFLRKNAHFTPDIKYIRAIPNLLIKPIHNQFIPDSELESLYKVTDIKMFLNLRECVDSAIYFTPHLYDNKEIRFFYSKLKNIKNPVFLDIGANIGFWSLYLSNKNRDLHTYAIEANPSTFLVLKRNVEINNLSKINLFNVGLSDKTEKIPFYCNITGNRGGDSFKENGQTPSMYLDCKSLLDICKDESIEKIDAIKFDIEGFEYKVISKFFQDAPNSLFPILACVETCHSDFEKLNVMMLHNDYKIALKTKSNVVYER